MVGARVKELTVSVGSSDVTTSRASNLEERILATCSGRFVSPEEGKMQAGDSDHKSSRI